MRRNWATVARSRRDRGFAEVELSDYDDEHDYDYEYEWRLGSSAGTNA